jgi:hypothetical protein
MLLIAVNFHLAMDSQSVLTSLTGSERQRQSGATGERLKEASGINVSLTVLGQVIMSLVDAQHGRRRHVPYRNSRLTFLLQVWRALCVTHYTAQRLLVRRTVDPHDAVYNDVLLAKPMCSRQPPFHSCKECSISRSGQLNSWAQQTRRE